MSYDDPTLPAGPQVARDWVDFVERVARPIVESEDDTEAEQAAMRLYRQVSPHYICACMVMMANRIEAGREADDFMSDPGNLRWRETREPGDS